MNTTFRKVMVFLGLLLFFVVWFDYVIAGPISLRDIKMVDAKRQSVLTLSNPIVIPSHDKNDIYKFTFTLPKRYLDVLYTPRLLPDDCIDQIIVEGQNISLEGRTRSDLCYETGGSLPLSELDPLVLAGHPIEVMVSDPGGVRFGLSIVRESLLSAPMRMGLLALGLYLVTLSVATKGQYRRFHYTWFVSLLAIGTFLPHNYRIDDYWWWTNYIANGVAIAAIALILCAWAPIRSLYAWIDRLLERILSLPPTYFVGACCLAFFALAAWLCDNMYSRIPHIADTHIYYRQSKMFAQGYLYEMRHPLSQFFGFQFMVEDGDKLYSQYFPGFPMLLAIGQLLGAPWLVNPAVGALTLLVTFLLAKELGGKSAGYIASALMLVAPLVMFMSSEFQSHASVMLFLTLFLYAYIKLCKTADWRFAILAGASVGFAAVIRMQATVPFALPVMLHAIWVFIRSPKQKFLNSLLLLLSFSIFIAFLMYYNYVTTGDPLRTPYERNGEDQVFAKFIYAWRWRNIFTDLSRAVWQLEVLQQHLFGWPTSSLWGVFLLLIMRKVPPYGFLLYLCFFGQFLGLIFVHGTTGSIYFPRYIYESCAILIVLNALGLKAAVDGLVNLSRHFVAPSNIRGAAVAMVVILVALAFPSRVTNSYREYSNNYWEGNWGYYYMLNNSVQTPAVLFFSDYGSFRQVYFSLPQTEDSPIIFARDRGAENEKLMEYYPNRNYYRVVGWDLIPLKKP